jgi:hypothetical protein
MNKIISIFFILFSNFIVSQQITFSPPLSLSAISSNGVALNYNLGNTFIGKQSNGISLNVGFNKTWTNSIKKNGETGIKTTIQPGNRSTAKVQKTQLL